MNGSKKTKLTKTEERVLSLLYEAHQRNETGSIPWMVSALKISREEVLKALERLVVLGMVSPPPQTHTLEDVDRILREMDENTECTLAERVLVASILIGSGDEPQIVAMGLPADEVRTIGDRLRQNGVWDAGGIDMPDGVEFWMLVNIADGGMTRVFDRKRGTWLYSLTPEARDEIDRLMKR